MIDLPILDDGIVSLRALHLKDAEGNYPNWLNNPEVTKYNSHGDIHYTKKMAEDYITFVQESKTQHVFAIIYEQNHIGNISLQNIDYKNNSAEFAILIGEPLNYAKGIGFKAGKLLLTHAFNTLTLHRIYCGTSSKNVAMQKLALKLGMKEEGRRIQALYKNKEYVDVIEYGILRSQYR